MITSVDETVGSGGVGTTPSSDASIASDLVDFLAMVDFRDTSRASERERAGRSNHLREA